MRKALIVRGGWDGHEPMLVSERYKRILQKEGFEVEVSDTLEILRDVEMLKQLHLFVPVWTMGTLPGELTKPIAEAVGGGVGIAGNHGGMCDAFRDNTEWQFVTGGQWVSHPGGGDVEYTVNMRRTSSPITDGIIDFDVKSEQYYVHVDPCIEVLATTRFPVVNYYHASNGEVDVPVVWTKRWGHGRVFYSSLGHVDNVFDIPEAEELMRRGFLWAAEGKDIAIKQNLSADDFKSTAKMY